MARHLIHRSFAPWAAALTMAAMTSALLAAGPVWEKEREFWSFRPLVEPPLPAVRDHAWARQPIDRFILARLEAAQLSPAPPAPGPVWLRRLSFDLTGLPPAPDEAAAIASDPSESDCAQIVDRWLARPGFGERMATLWLPLARYAEDQAHQVGNDTKFFYPNAWRYRSWVIAAFNTDLPYDRFVKLQLAADRLGPEAQHDLAALGFLGLGPKYYDRKRLSVMMEEWEDRVDTVCRTTMGLTVGCARCHDHKLEPITMADFYGLAGVFASTRMVHRSPDGSEEKDDLAGDKRNPATLHVVADGELRDLAIFERGDPEKAGPTAPRRFLRVLSGGEPAPFTDGSGRRELAEAIASPQNPLTARVFVNRIWGAIFGRPLVSTPSNFGHSGATPSHPELLDYLAARFVARGWSVKNLVREMVLSATYRQSAAASAAATESDPANALLSHMNRRRLTIEQWRDTALWLAGDLDPATDGPSQELDSPQNLRRTVYSRISRKQLDDMLQLFDYPDANVHAERRSQSTTATQKLFLLNSPFIIDRARALARRLARPSTPDWHDLEAGYLLVFGRLPTTEEMVLGLEFLEGPNDPEAGLSRWEQHAQAWLASNELLYVD